MRIDDVRRRGHGRGGARRKAARPELEGLEGRLLLYATTGGAWSNPNLITYSIVPDGTNVAGYASDLGQVFNAKWSPTTWATVIAEAAAVWEQVANINLVAVPDDGAPVGAGPDQQGDPNHGDIRISGVPTAALGSGTLAYTFLPPPINGGSLAGDIIFNTGQSWQINSNFDLLTVAIHEFGHALGMGHSQMTTADMYAYYNGIKQSITSDDVAGIQSIYGPRQPDGIMASYHNSSASSAFDLTPYLNGQEQVSAPTLDIQNGSQAEWFKVAVPSGTTGSMVVTMQSTGLSMLSPGFQVMNSSLQVVNYALGSGYGATVRVTIGGVSPGQVYYIDTFASTGGPTSAGAYGLQVNFGSTPMPPIPSPVVTIPDQLSLGGGGISDSGPGSGHGHGAGTSSTFTTWLGAIGDQLMVAPSGVTLPPQLATAATGPLLLIAPADGGVAGDASFPGGPRKSAGVLWFGKVAIPV